jgi:hypothetical protein
VWCCEHLGVNPVPIRAAYLSGIFLVTSYDVYRRQPDRGAFNKAVEEAINCLLDEILNCGGVPYPRC